MALIIKDRDVVSDPWQLLEPAADGQPPSVPATGDVIIPAALWRAEREVLKVRAGRIGVWLKPDEDPASIAEDLPLFGVVAVAFPKLADGRGYSTGRLLRERYGYRGELRAIGDVQRDQLQFMWLCGFDSFALRAGEDPREALVAFAEMSESYQASVEKVLPLFRRRAAPAPDGIE